MANTRTTMSDRQARFVREYLVDGNGTRAAVAAGYGVAGARVAAHRLLTKVAIRAAIADRHARDTQRLELARQDVIKGLLEAVAEAKSQANPAAMIAGWREIGRMMGYYAPEVRQVVVGSGIDALRERFEAMTDSELASFAAIEVSAA